MSTSRGSFANYTCFWNHPIPRSPRKHMHAGRRSNWSPGMPAILRRLRQWETSTGPYDWRVTSSRNTINRTSALLTWHRSPVLVPFRMVRTFTRQIGLPPHAYLNQVRVNRAKQLLANGEPIALVAYETGFADQSHLTRHFKRLFGLTPGQYSMRQERSRPFPDQKNKF
jgi:hypothetical protein